MTPFQAHYRRFVVPRLQRMAHFQGLRVVLGAGYSEAFAVIMHEALRLGAAHLPGPLLHDLEEAVSDWLTAAIEEAQPAWDEAQRLADRVAQQIERHERAL